MLVALARTSARKGLVKSPGARETLDAFSPPAPPTAIDRDGSVCSTAALQRQIAGQSTEGRQSTTPPPSSLWLVFQILIRRGIEVSLGLSLVQLQAHA